MSRIQKKCFIASTGFHLLLVVLLFVGPAFLSPNNSKVDDSMVLTFDPWVTTDDHIQGGGTPRATPAAAPAVQRAQPEPPKAVAPPKAEAPEPAAKDPKPDKRETESLEPTTKPKIKVNLNKVVRKTTAQTAKASTTKSPATDETPAKDLQALKSAMNNVRSGLSSSTAIEMPTGPGGGGVPYANFRDAVGKVYYDAWVAPEGEATGDTRVEATVTIARNGEVLSARITKPSGNAAIDQSVQATLDRVRFAVPLPAGTSESQRVVPIGFTARIRQGTG